jgi:hypothetical protein
MAKTLSSVKYKYDGCQEIKARRLFHSEIVGSSPSRLESLKFFLHSSFASHLGTALTGLIFVVMASNTNDATGQDVELSRTVSNGGVKLPIEHAEEAAKDVDGERLPRPEDIIESLGIPNWRQLEKKIVRRLDMTLLPTFWILYIFNYLDRASLEYEKINPSASTKLTQCLWQTSSAEYFGP